MNRQAVFAEDLCRAHRRVELKAQFVEPASDVDDFRLVSVSNREQHRALADDILAGSGDEALVDRVFEGLRDTENFPGGFHFRPELGIDVFQLREAEDRHLDRDVMRVAMSTIGTSVTLEMYGTVRLERGLTSMT